MPLTMPSIAWSMGASSKTMFAALPPSSRVTFLSVPATCFAIARPTAVDPVNATLSTSSWATRAAPVSPAALAAIWRDRRLRASVFGYFGHMWELYAFYVLLPAIVATRLATSAEVHALSFWAIAAGALGCAGGGLLARRWGSARVAQVQLAASGLCCVASLWMLQAPLPLFAAWLLLWGVTVAGDSPQFSALTALNAPAGVTGSVLTFANCIGFAISVASIELFVRAAQAWPLAQVLPWLGLGPALGLLMLRPLLRAAAPVQVGRIG